MKLRFYCILLLLIVLPLSAVDSIGEIKGTPKPEDPAVLTHRPESPVAASSEPESLSEGVAEIKESAVQLEEKKEPVSEAIAPEIPKAEKIPAMPKVGLESVAIPEGTPYFVGARYYEKKSGGWGWIKKTEESWKKARWAAIKESPKQFHVPHRNLKKAEEDHEFQYKLLGSFADYQVYDPVRDELLDVFIIEGYESLGAQKSIDRKPGPPGRFSSKKSGAYTRRNNIQFEDTGF